MFGFFKKPSVQSGRAGKNKIVRPSPNVEAGKRVVARKKSAKTGGAGGSFWIGVLGALLTAGLAGATVYAVIFSPLLRIKSVTVDGLESLDSRSVIETASKIMDRRYWDVFDGSNLILASDDKIEKALLDRFKKIESVETRKKFPDKLEISVKERGSILVFCDGSACSVIDRNGQAFAKADFQSNELDEQKLIVLRDLSRKDVPMAEVSIDTGLAGFLNEVKMRLEKELDVETRQEWSTPTLISGDLRAETAEGWKIYFNYAIGVEKEIEMLKTVLANSLDKARRADLEYIDLRLDNKVYYKLKSAPAEEEDNEEEERDVPATVAEKKDKKKK